MNSKQPGYHGSATWKWDCECSSIEVFPGSYRKEEVRVKQYLLLSDTSDSVHMPAHILALLFIVLITTSTVSVNSLFSCNPMATVPPSLVWYEGSLKEITGPGWKGEGKEGKEVKGRGRRDGRGRR